MSEKSISFDNSKDIQQNSVLEKMPPIQESQLGKRERESPIGKKAEKQSSNSDSSFELKTKNKVSKELKKRQKISMDFDLQEIFDS